MRAHRLALLAAGTALAAAVGPGTAFAHVEVESTSPARGATAKTSIRSVKVNFSGAIQRGTLRVTGPGKKVVSIGTGGRAAHNISRLRVSLKRSLKPGRYRAKWSATSADGHSEDGSFRFRLKG